MEHLQNTTAAAARPRLDEGDPTPAITSGLSHPSPTRLRRGLILSDLAAIVVGVTLATITLHVVRSVEPVPFAADLAANLVLVPLLLAAMAAFKLFTARVVASQVEEGRRILAAVAAALVCGIALAFVVDYDDVSRLNALLVYGLVAWSLLFSRSIVRRVFYRLRRTRRISRPVIVAGTGIDAIAIMHTTERRPELGYSVIGFTGDAVLSEHGDMHVLGPVDDTLEIARATGATGVILSVPSLQPAVVNRLTRTLTREGFHVTLSSSLRDIDLSRARPQSLDGQLMIYVEPTHPTRTRLMFKRFFDIVGAATVLVLTAPILLVAVIAIALDSRGPVIFSQVRVGKDGRHFRIHKLRTMVADAEAQRAALEPFNEADGALFKMRNDPRVTRVGRFLRKTSIDELPQLWNVLYGEMSIVGPRPALPAEAERWSDDLRERLMVLPGITGLWQVSGRSDSDFEQYERLDLYYVDNWSLLHDLKIVVRTMFVVIRRRGAL